MGKTSGYVPSTSSTVSTINFSSYNDISQLNNVGVRIGSSRYVFTDATSKNYRNSRNKIDISDFGVSGMGGADPIYGLRACW
ncbi:MAG: hypothetical protein IJK81_12720 [Selenomonadaceae bacterium]|nr:hypothetical protein [Selenomonadaceae bacterium]